VTYKDASFKMDALRDFVAAQVQKGQGELEELLLLHEGETREDTVPRLSLYRLQDNHSNNSKGWNFLHDPRNAAVFSGGGGRWLLNRVLENEWLRDEMIFITKGQMIKWRKLAVEKYFAGSAGAYIAFYFRYLSRHHDAYLSAESGGEMYRKMISILSPPITLWYVSWHGGCWSPFDTFLVDDSGIPDVSSKSFSQLWSKPSHRTNF
jgi:hypothetical protein